MNQILHCYKENDSNKNISNDINNLKYSNNAMKLGRISKFLGNSLLYKYVFCFSLFVLSVLFVHVFRRLSENNKNENIAKKLNSTSSVSKLYSSTNNLENSSLYSYVTFVIWLIRIDKINLNYSILSSSNSDLLDISVCRFAGPMPNRIGNLCIAGHNYVDYKFFSRLNELEIDDEINIYDLNGNNILYKIYDIYETTPDDTTCTFQNTDNQRIVTLVTCNNVNGKRLIIHAKEIS